VSDFRQAERPNTDPAFIETAKGLRPQGLSFGKIAKLSDRLLDACNWFFNWSHSAIKASTLATMLSCSIRGGKEMRTAWDILDSCAILFGSDQRLSTEARKTRLQHGSLSSDSGKARCSSHDW